MSLDDHIKIAAAELAKAADLARIEIDQLRSELAREKRERNVQMAHITQQMGDMQNDMDGNDESFAKAKTKASLGLLQRQLAKEKQEYDNHIKDIDKQIREKQELINTLETKSKSL